jgi:hypothetical protein
MTQNMGNDHWLKPLAYSAKYAQSVSQPLPDSSLLHLVIESTIYLLLAQAERPVPIRSLLELVDIVIYSTGVRQFVFAQ